MTRRHTHQFHRHVTTRRVVPMLAMVLVAAACSGGSDDAGPVVIGDNPTVPASTAPTATSAPPTTTAPTATTPATTQAPTTTAAPTTTIAPATTAPTATTPATTEAPTTTAAPTTTVAPTTTTTEPEPVIPSVPADPSLTEWVGIEEGLPEAFGDGVNCLPFYTEMGLVSDQACGPWDSADGTHVWTVGKTGTDRWFAAVWRRTGDFSWQPALRLLEDEPLTWQSVTLVAADVDSGPADELVSGVRFEGSGGFLMLDVIDSLGGFPTVVGHMPAVDSGAATIAEDVGVFVYEADYAPADPLCCPSAFVQYLLARTPGGWVIEEGAVGIDPGAVPPSAF